MSLIVTSNVSLNDKPETSEVFKPYSYSNTLLNTMKVPANSSIAVQSCKINKSGMYSVKKDNSQFALFYGEDVVAGETDMNTAGITSTPTFGNVGNITGEQVIERTPNSLASDITVGLSKSIYHPTLTQPQTVSQSVAAVVSRTADGDFDGYGLAFTPVANKTATVPSQACRNITWNAGTGFTDDDAGTVLITGNPRALCTVQYTEGCVANTGGEVIFDITGVDGGVGTVHPWRVGLSRFNKQREPTSGLDIGIYAPEAYNWKEGIATKWKRGEFYDIVVFRQGDDLFVAQSCIDGSEDPYGNILQKELVYYGAHNTDFATQYDIATNADAYTQVKFTISNEIVEIHMGTAANAFTLLTSWTQYAAAGGGDKPNKNEIPLPISCEKWYLYPMMGLSTYNDALTLDSVSTYDHHPANFSQDNGDCDWWCHLQQQGLETWASDITDRYWYNVGDFPNTYYKNADGVGDTPAYKGYAGAIMEDYRVKILTAPSELYGGYYTQPLNSMYLLGFDANSVASSGVSAVGVFTIASNSVPKLVSNTSLFIRLNNFTQQSINAKQGSLNSKILAHLPRFDNAGNETGGLFFEPPSRVYIDLNNPNEFYINTLDVDICYDNEQLCTALTGKTIVCFHLKQNK